jgi:hypothetical protein
MNKHLLVHASELLSKKDEETEGFNEGIPLLSVSLPVYFQGVIR